MELLRSNTPSVPKLEYCITVRTDVGASAYITKEGLLIKTPEKVGIVTNDLRMKEWSLEAASLQPVTFNELGDEVLILVRDLSNAHIKILVMPNGVPSTSGSWTL